MKTTPNDLERLTSAELDQLAGDLDQAVEDHVSWLARITRTLVCSAEPAADDLKANPHHLCHFGRWYHGVDDSPLLELEAFRTIGPVHRDLHAAARDLLLKHRHREPIGTTEYDRLMALSDQLRRLLMEVRSTLKQNLSVVSKLMGSVFENAHEGVLITTPDGTIVHVNRAFTEVTGYSAEEAIGETPHLLYSGRQGKEFYRQLWKGIEEEGNWQGEIWNRRKNGDVYLEWLNITAVRGAEGRITHYVAIFSDITSDKENEERLWYLAHFDPLTDLPNRVMFHDRFKQAIARARRAENKAAVLFLDLDGFKEINDTHGHAAGDELLSLVAERLRNLLRESDTVARIGGDEFAIIVPDVDQTANVLPVVDKVLNAIVTPFPLERCEARISTSIGISIFPDHGRDVDNLLNRADAAMYQAKRAGKNRYQVFETPAA